MRFNAVLAMSATAACGMAIGGCRSIHDQPCTEPAASTMPRKPTASAADPKIFTASRGNFTTSLPEGWKQLEKGGDYVLAIAPNGTSGEDAIVSVQFPDLPPHIPGFLPLGGIADGYVNDLKKRYPDEKVDQRENAKLDNADARQIASSFQKDGKPYREIAMLAVHGDHVYVVCATAPTKAFELSQKAFNAVTSDWKWTP